MQKNKLEKLPKKNTHLVKSISKQKNFQHYHNRKSLLTIFRYIVNFPSCNFHYTREFNSIEIKID